MTGQATSALSSLLSPLSAQNFSLHLYSHRRRQWEWVHWETGLEKSLFISFSFSLLLLFSSIVSFKSTSNIEWVLVLLLEASNRAYPPWLASLELFSPSLCSLPVFASAALLLPTTVSLPSKIQTMYLPFKQGFVSFFFFYSSFDALWGILLPKLKSFEKNVLAGSLFDLSSFRVCFRHESS